MNQQEIINTIALLRVNYFTLAGMLELYRRVGSATAIMENTRNIRDILPDASDRLIASFANIDEARRFAEAEYERIMALGITPLPMNGEDYPGRLRECPDAPLMLFYKGTASLISAISKSISDVQLLVRWKGHAV